VDELSYSPDGRMLAVLTSIGFEVREADSGRAVNTVARPATAVLNQCCWDWSWVSELCWSPDGKRIARAAGGLEIWNPLGKAPERTFPATENDTAFGDLAWSPKGDRIAARSEQGIVLFDIVSGRRTSIPEPTNEEEGIYRSVHGFSWAPDGRQLAVAVVVAGTKSGMSIDVWDAQRLVLLRRIPIRGATQPDGGGTRRGVQEGQKVEIYPPEPKVEWSPDGQVIALNGGTAGLSLWDAHTGRLLRRLGLGQARDVVSLAWSRDSQLLYVGTPQEIRFIRRADGTPAYVLENNNADLPMRSTSVSSDGKQLASFLAGFNDAEIDSWRGKKRAPYARIPWKGVARSVELSPDGNRFSVRLDGRFEIRDSDSGRILMAIPTPGQVSWSPNGDVLVASAGDYHDLLRAADGRPISSIRARGLTWSPNGDLIAEAMHDVRLLRAADGEVVESIKVPPRPGNPGRGYFVASWSPNGRRVLLEDAGEPPQYLDPAVFSLDDKTLRPPPAGKGRLFWVGPEEMVRSSIPHDSNVVQSPDRQYVAALPSTGSVRNWRFWDLRANRLLVGSASEGPPNTGRLVVWSPDSKRVAYLTGTGELDVWDLAGARIVERWNAPGSDTLQDLVWREKLTVTDILAGAVRVWREP
jgi:WD40 repeat protein